MRKRPVQQMSLVDGWVSSVPPNEFLEKLNQLVDWKPIEKKLEGMFTATRGRLPKPPLVVFKMLVLQHCYNLSDPQCEEMVQDRLSWRKFVGLSFEETVPDETTLVRFRQRMIEHGLGQQLLAMVNLQLEQKNLILKRVTLVDATLLQASRRAPGSGGAGGDKEADFTVKQGQPHYGYKAHVAVDEENTMIRAAEMSAASVHDSQRLEEVVRGDEAMVVADKAYWSRKHSQWLEDRGIANGILRKARRGQSLGEPGQRMNRFLSGVRCRIEKVFGHWKRSMGYQRVRYLGLERNRLELAIKSVCWNLKRMVHVLSA